jgi:hypothetical protein
MKISNINNHESQRKLVEGSANDPIQVVARTNLAEFTAKTFKTVASELGVASYRSLDDGSNWEEGVAVSMLLHIAAQLTSASNDLFADGRHYAAAALLRQLVEVEYLAWAFETKDQEAQRWLRSSAEERWKFFTPAKLRQAAGGTFRSKDYSYHCEMGGHPVPDSALLLAGRQQTAQLLLSDLLGHTGRIWDHLLRWSALHPRAIAVHQRRETMYLAYSAWQQIDQLIQLPPPP